jgi:cyclophilin family peptidyl-prolyl cis-trans isomerase
VILKLIRKALILFSPYIYIPKHRFGPGPHYISIRVALDERNPSSVREIVIQLAPLELMPHSIHLFLTQISEGYWNVGTPAFVLNAEHVLQACPHPCLESVEFGGNSQSRSTNRQTEPYEDMKRAGLDTVSFQEYSTRVPHEKYTIGFAGRPHSGPEFYINLMDNSLDHGTLEERKYHMGPTKYAAWTKEVLGSNGVLMDVGEGEMLVDVDAMVAIEPYPCFGKVIDGFDVVDEIARGMTRASLPKSEVEEGGYQLDPNLLLRPVHITSMTILKDYQPDGRLGTTKIEL